MKLQLLKTSDGKYYRPAGEAETGTYKTTVSANSDTPKMIMT